MKKLADLINATDVGEVLEYIHAMVALVERNGSLVSWNRAFETHKTNYPHAANLQNCFSSKERDRITNRLDLDQPDPFVVEIDDGGEGKSVFYDCVILPLANGHSLFIGEHISSNASMQEIIQRLNRRIRMFQVESEHAKKIARNKQTEVDGIMVQAHELTNTDVLTFLPNRRMIVKTLQNEVARAERYSAPLSISVVDVDHFKNVNDTHGHMAGDEVLRHIAFQLRDHIRHPDVVGRYGGEEFLILLPNTASEEAAEQAARLCRYVRDAQVHVNQHVLSLTVSIGVAQYQPGVDTWDSLLNRADNAMYEAKNNGRDQCYVAK